MRAEAKEAEAKEAAADIGKRKWIGLRHAEIKKVAQKLLFGGETFDGFDYLSEDCQQQH